MTKQEQKIRFRKRGIQNLDQLPSAGNTHGHFKSKRYRSSLGLRFWPHLFRGTRILCSLLILVTLLGGTAFVFLRAGINSEILRSEAQERLQQILGVGVQASIANAQISLDGNHHLALEAQNVTLTEPVYGVAVEAIGAVRLGLSPLALMMGNIRVSQIELDGAVIRLPDGGQLGSSLLQLPYDERGLLDLDMFSDAVFAGVAEAVQLLDLGQTKSVTIRDAHVSFRMLDEDQELVIKKAELTDIDQQVTINATFGWKGQDLELNAQVVRGEQREERSVNISKFDIELANVPLEFGSANKVYHTSEGERPNPTYFHVRSNVILKLSGEDNEKRHKSISGNMQFHDALLDLGRSRDLPANVNLSFKHQSGSDKIDVTIDELNLAGLKTRFEGAFGPEPMQASASEQNAGGDSKQSAYRFELLSTKAVSEVQGSGESPLNFGAGFSGRLSADMQQIEFNELSVRTAEGELYGQGTMIFGSGSPAMIFLLRIPFMPIADAKQLWPLTVVDGARNWVLANLFGGNLHDSLIDIALPAGHFSGASIPPPLTASEITADFNITGTRFDVIGEIPAVRNADGKVVIRGADTVINLSKGTAYTASDRIVNVGESQLTIPWQPQRPVMADLDLNLTGDAAAVTELSSYPPINAGNKLPFSAQDLSGNVAAKVKLTFPLTKGAPKDSIKWNADVKFDDVALKQPFNGQKITQAEGQLELTKDAAKITAKAHLNGIPAQLEITEPLQAGSVKRKQDIRLQLDEESRKKLYPALNNLFKGPMVLQLGDVTDGVRKVTADLTKTTVSLPWLGWKKGAGIPAKAVFNLYIEPDKAGNINLRQLVFSGAGFNISGDIVIANDTVQSATLSKLSLTRSDNLKVTVKKTANGYRADVRGSSLDARALIQKLMGSAEADTDKSAGNNLNIVINAHINEVTGFNDGILRDVTVSYEAAGAKTSSLSLSAVITGNARVSATSNKQQEASSIALQSTDAGSVLRFLDLYDKMAGGKIEVNLTSQGKGPLKGRVNASSFSIINEPRLDRLVSSPSGGNGKSLNQAVRKKIDVTRADFERGSAQIEKGDGYLKLDKGVVRGPVIGTTFQGTVYDTKGNMSITGTFMPAYGLNRLFGELPILGAILGNGRDRGLIGITFKLNGKARQPNIIVNPVSAIAPGIFRSIFEFQE